MMPRSNEPNGTGLTRRDFISTVASGAALAAVAGLTAGPTHGQDAAHRRLPPVDPRVNRLIAYYPIGGSSPSAQRRSVGWNIADDGWKGFVTQQMGPALRWGVRRVQLQNPFGTLPEESMQFDQYLHAREAGMKWLYEGFVEAWKPITDEGVEVIAYLGKLQDDPDFDALREQGKPAEYLARLYASTSLPLQAGMSIALDASSHAPADHPVYAFAQQLRSLGTKVYIEPRPPKTTPHWFEYPIISTDRFWYRSDPERYPVDSGPWAARNDQLRGEVIRIITQPPPSKTWQDISWQIEAVQRIISEGHTAATAINGFMRSQRRIEQVLGIAA